MLLMLMLPHSPFFVCERNEIESEVLSLRAKQKKEQQKNDDVNEPTESEVSKIITKSLSRLFCVPCLFFHGIYFNGKTFTLQCLCIYSQTLHLRMLLHSVYQNVYTPLAIGCVSADARAKR